MLLKFVIFILYTLLGWLSTVVSAWGNQSLNNALSVPCFSCAQVITNGLTGIFVWGDMARLQDKVAYLMVYVLIVLGIYLCAHVDMVSLFFSKTQSPVRDSVQDLLDSLAPSTSLEREKTVGVALTNFLHEAQDQHIAKSEMRDLLVSLIDVMEENDALKPEMAKKVEAYFCCAFSVCRDVQCVVWLYRVPECSLKVCFLVLVALMPFMLRLVLQFLS